MVMIERKDIEEASRRIDGYIRKTPVLKVRGEDVGINAELYLKLEYLQHTGSFKPRGAFNNILQSKVTSSGIIAASGGNHGAAVAYAAQKLGIRAEIFVPTISSPVKVERLKQYNANITITGRDYAEALEASYQRAKETGAVSIHAYDDDKTLAGAGTVGLELEEQKPNLDSVFVAVGGGGLIGGIGAWYQHKTRVIGVEPETAKALHYSLEQGKISDYISSGIAADSLGARRIGDLVFPIAQQFVREVILVSDDEIVRAQKLLWQQLRIMAEPGGAAAFAAVISGTVTFDSGSKIGVILCGANVDLGKFTA